MARIAYMAVRNWPRYQHYKDGRPITWVKFYISLLDDPEIRALPVDVRLLWDQLLLVAGRTDNCIPRDTEWLAGVTSLGHASIKNGTKILLKGAWLQGFHSRRALYQNRQEKRREEKTANAENEPVENHLADKLIGEIRDANDRTTAIVHSLENTLPDAAFATALESLQARRTRTDREPLTSEARYVVAALKAMQREGQYQRDA